MNGVIVTTRVPSNIISFSSGSAITINGGIVMDLVRRRKLLPGALPSETGKTEEEKASFTVIVGLARKPVSDEETPIKSAGSIVKKGIGIVFAFASYFFFVVW